MVDWGNAGSGALGGASAGASIGSVIPGLGTALGAGIGGIFGGIAGLFGKKKKKKRATVSSLDERQQQLNTQQHDSILGKGPLADLYNYDPQSANEVFDKTIANPAYRGFEEELAPKITGQFRKQGLINSSYAGDALAKAGRDVQESLDAKRAEYLYGEQKDARNAKRTAVENLQDRQTFAYDKSANQGDSGFDISNILSSITPNLTDHLQNYFKPKAGVK